MMWRDSRNLRSPWSFTVILQSVAIANGRLPSPSWSAFPSPILHPVGVPDTTVFRTVVPPGEFSSIFAD